MNKKILVLFASLFTSNAIAACPDLKGFYICKDDNGDYPLIVEQEVINKTTVYTFLKPESLTHIPVDNFLYSFDDESSGMQGTTKYSCSAESTFDTSVEAKVIREGIVLQQMQMVQQSSLDNAKNLVTKTTGVVSIAGISSPYEQVEVCTRSQAPAISKNGINNSN